MRALDGIKVLDLTHALAGPFCTYQLALMGAEVVKIEKPGVGDDFRDFARVAGWDASPSFIAVNGGKRSITVNIKFPEGLAIIRKLAQGADVVVENQRPGALKRMGLGYEDLKAVNPKLVYCSLSGFGQEGEMARWPAYDHTIKAISGMMWSGADDDIPTQARGFSVDLFSGYVAFAAILSGLLRRERAGEGQYLDVAMLDASMVLMGVGLVRQLITGDNVSPTQPIVHDRPTVNAYRTCDGWIWLSANFQNHWEALCGVIGAPHLVADPRFKDLPTRNANSAILKPILAELIAPLSAPALEKQLMAAGCPAAKVRTARETLEIAGASGRGSLIPSEVGGAPISLINAGFVADDGAPGLSSGVPVLGADTDAVLAELGYGADDVARLRETGVI
jgi:crotonobetainyl-CoA:carnitine CoA-transferase CaiB-like acyl-CoA transferase